MNNIQLAGYTLYRQDRTAASGKTRGGGLCIFVNNSWCTISKEVSRFCSPEVENCMISCRPHYLPREFSSIFFIAVYLPPWREAKVSLLPKSGKAVFTGFNSRPINLLSALSKLLDKIVFDQIQCYFSVNKLTSDFQHAYRVGHSMGTALTQLTNDCLK